MSGPLDAQPAAEESVEIGPEEKYAAGGPAILVSLRRSVEQMGVTRPARTLARLNQRHGFGCPGSATPGIRSSSPHFSPGQSGPEKRLKRSPRISEGNKLPTSSKTAGGC